MGVRKKWVVYMMVMLFAGCGGNGTGGGPDAPGDAPGDSISDAPPDAPGPTGNCTGPERLWLSTAGANTTGTLELGDAPATFTLSNAGTVSLAVEQNGATVLSATLPPEHWAFAVSVGELASGGLPEVIVNAFWDDSVWVFDLTAGVNQSYESAHATVHVERDPGGLHVLFGFGLAVLDFNGDGENDLAIAAPGEGEEACAAQEPVRVFFGPLTGTIDGDAPDVAIAVPDIVQPPNPPEGDTVYTKCWGHELFPWGEAGDSLGVWFQRIVQSCAGQDCDNSSTNVVRDFSHDPVGGGAIENATTVCEDTEAE